MAADTANDALGDVVDWEVHHLCWASQCLATRAASMLARVPFSLSRLIICLLELRDSKFPFRV